MMHDAATVRAPADIARAIRESAAFTPETLHERQRVGFGVALAAQLCATPALLERGVTTAMRWIGDGNAHVPRSLRGWQVLCTAGDVDTVLLALEAMTEYADELRVSHPLVGILDDGDVAVISARARGEEPARAMGLA